MNSLDAQESAYREAAGAYQRALDAVERRQTLIQDQAATNTARDLVERVRRGRAGARRSARVGIRESTKAEINELGKLQAERDQINARIEALQRGLADDIDPNPDSDPDPDPDIVEPKAESTIGGKSIWAQVVEESKRKEAWLRQ